MGYLPWDNATADETLRQKLEISGADLFPNLPSTLAKIFEM
jgi:hypothetical protein